MTNMVFRERILINSMLHLTFSMAPNIVSAPNIRRTQNTDTGRKTQTQLISALHSMGTTSNVLKLGSEH